MELSDVVSPNYININDPTASPHSVESYHLRRIHSNWSSESVKVLYTTSSVSSLYFQSDLLTFSSTYLASLFFQKVSWRQLSLITAKRPPLPQPFCVTIAENSAICIYIRHSSEMHWEDRWNIHSSSPTTAQHFSQFIYLLTFQLVC